jgi:hypothetical protein
LKYENPGKEIDCRKRDAHQKAMRLECIHTAIMSDEIDRDASLCG